MKRYWLLTALLISGCSQAGGGAGANGQADAAGPANAVASADPAAPIASPAASASSSPTPAAASAHRYADWAGRYVGQEGLFVVVRPTTAGKYSLEMMGDEAAGAKTATYTGEDTPSGIAFERDGKTELLRRGTADEINLKYVEGDDCLMVKEFEGFCREK